MNTETEESETAAILREIRAEISALKEAIAPLGALRRELAEVKVLATAPRAVAIDDDLILAKLAFDNLMLAVDRRDRLIGPHLIMNGMYEKSLTSYFRAQMANTSVFVDVGANIGYYTCLFGKYLRDRGHVFAFEPDDRNYAILKQNTQINWIDRKNIVLEKLGVSDAKGFATIYHSVVKAGNASLIEPHAEERLKLDFNSYKIDLTSLDEYFADKNLNVDIMKVDVEGLEFSVLKGAEKLIARTPGIKIVLEWDPARWARISISARQVVDFLASLDLSFYSISQNGQLVALSSADLEMTRYANIVCERANSQ